jgi:DNA-binding NarL/FixJ family response regulator
VDSPDPLRVAVGRFANVVALGLAAILEEDAALEIVCMGLDYRALRKVLQESSDAPDVVMLDEGEAISAVVHGLRAASPGVEILVIAHAWTPGTRLHRLRLAKLRVASLSADATATEIRAAVRLAAKGQALAAQPSRSATLLDDFFSLTPREREVFGYLRRGRGSAQIAHELHISEQTVRSHVKKVYRKLRVRTRTQLLDLDVPDDLD